MKKLEKISNYHELRLQAQKLLNAVENVIPTVFCALDAVNEKHLKNIGILAVLSCLQNTALLWRGFNLRSVLDSQIVGNSKIPR